MNSALKLIHLLVISIIMSLGVGAVSSSVTLQDSIIQSGDETGINVTADQTSDKIYVILDNNSNGNFDISTDLIESGSVSSAGISQHIGYFNSTNTSSVQEGTYTVYAVQQSNKPNDGEIVTGQTSTSIEFDNTNPDISDFKANKLNFYSANISFTSNEVLERISVRREPEISFNTFDLFSSNSSSPPIKYWTEFKIETEGEAKFILTNARDRANNDGSNDQNQNISFDPIVKDLELGVENDSPYAKLLSYDDLSSINLSLGGNASDYLDLPDFSESISNGEYVYEANLTGIPDGNINATLLEATNSTGEDGAWGQTDEQEFQIPPKVEKFYLSVSGQDVTLNVDANEKLSVLNASYGGTVSNGELKFADFTESQDAGFYNYTADIPSGQEGTYNATFNFAEDDSGNRNSTELTNEIVVDSTAPTISEYSVSNLNGNNIDISFNSSEELDTIKVDGSGMESFTLTEVDFSTDESAAPFNYYTTYEASNEGELTVTLNEAKDASGNNGASGTSQDISVKYPPTIHEFDLFANSQDVDLEVNVSEQLNNLTVDLSQDVSETLDISNFTETNPSPYYIYTADISEGTEGEFEATLQSTNDSQGLDGSDGESDILLLDNNAPPNPDSTTITDSPITGSNEESVSVEINFSSSTETGELKVRFNSSDSNSIVKSTDVNSADQLQVFDFDLSDLPDSEIWAESKMIDEAGNVNDEGFTANSSAVTKEATPPEVQDAITGDSLSGGSTARDEITVEFSDSVGLDSSSVQNPDFTVIADSQVRTTENISATSNTVEIKLSEDLDTGAQPTIEIVNIRDNFDNSIDTTKQVIARDGLKPQIVSAVVDNSASTSTETYVDLTFSESVVTDGHTVTIDGKTVSFQSDGTNTDKHSVNYGELLDTGTSPNVSSVNGVDDIEANTAIVANGEVTVNSFRKTLDQGMNLISFPIEDKSNPSINQLLPENKINTVWAYYNGKWQVYNPNASNNDFNQIKGGYGYIIDANQEFTLNPNVNTVASSNVAEYPVNNGWNLIGQMQEYNQEADSGGAISSTVSVNEIHKKTDETSLGYKRIDSGAFTPEDMKPGNGYWMDSSDSSSLLTPNFSASQSTIVIEMVRGIAGFIGQVFSFLAGVVG